MEQYRLVATPEGPITYRLVKKRVKNLNLRLDRTGEVVLSVPLRCPAERADAFVIEKSVWIVGHLPKPEEAPFLLPEPDRRECARLLGEAVLRVYPLVAGSGVSIAPDKTAEDEKSVGQLPLPAGVHHPEHRPGPLSGISERLCGPPRAGPLPPPRPRPRLLRGHGRKDAGLAETAAGLEAICSGPCAVKRIDLTGTPLPSRWRARFCIS